MSTDYDSMTVIGFVVPAEEAFKKFIVKRPGVFHMEDRFDAKTGKKIAPEKVIDEDDGLALVIDGEEYDFVPGNDEFSIFSNVGDEDADAIASIVKCRGFVTGDFHQGNVYACFMPNKLHSVDGVYAIKDVIKAQKEIARIGKALKKLGIDPGEGGIHTMNIVV